MQNKTEFEKLDNKIDTQFRKLNEKMQKMGGETKGHLTRVEESCLRLSDQITRMQGTLEVWDGKIRRLDSKMHSL